MSSINTELGKIYCSYNEDKDIFDVYRVTKISKNENDELEYIVSDVAPDYHIEESYTVFKESEYKKFVSDHTALKSDGIISLSNIISVQDESSKIKDVLLIYFPNNKYTDVPDTAEPYVVARQGIVNLFDNMMGQSGTVGMSVSINSLPLDYSLSDFMANDGVEDSIVCHTYKTDSIEDIVILLKNDNTTGILKDLLEHRLYFLENTRPDFVRPENTDHICIDGYCSSLYKFIETSGFMNDVKERMGVSVVDFKIEDEQPFNDDDKMFLMTLYGGIRINRAVPYKFTYEIDLSRVRAKYMLLQDSDEILYIVPYTEYPDEIDIQTLYNLTEERTKQIRERLSKIAHAYDSTKENC